MSAPGHLNLKKEAVWTIVALAMLALGLIAVTWLVQRPAVVISALRESSWLVWLLAAGGAAWRLIRRRRIAEESAGRSGQSSQALHESANLRTSAPRERTAYLEKNFSPMPAGGSPLAA